MVFPLGLPARVGKNPEIFIVLKLDTYGLGEDPKACERIKLKELGKLTL